jgi:hypothetical protein
MAYPKLAPYGAAEMETISKAPAGSCLPLPMRRFGKTPSC